jgi:hypothetical protein
LTLQWLIHMCIAEFFIQCLHIQYHVYIYIQYLDRTGTLKKRCPK